MSDPAAAPGRPTVGVVVMAYSTITSASGPTVPQLMRYMYAFSVGVAVAVWAWRWFRLDDAEVRARFVRDGRLDVPAA